MFNPSERRSRSLFRECRRALARRRLAVEALEERFLLSNVYQVKLSTDNGTGAAMNSLSWAIDQVNGDSSDTMASPDEITFSIGGGGLQTILETGALPGITRPVIIDGTTQPGPIPVGEEPIGLVGLGSSVPDDNGLFLGYGSDGSTVKGLAIGDFSNNGIEMYSGSNTITGDDIGTDVSGTSPIPNLEDGILILSSGNTIGGTTGAFNVISGNAYGGNAYAGAGVEIAGGFYNVVEGNDIGTDVTGTVALSDGVGVEIDDDAANNTIGGITAGTLNVISGNMGDGVVMSGSNTFANVVEGNDIGTDVTGTIAVPNGSDGIEIDEGALNNTIGGTGTGALNVVSGNASNGVEIADDTTSFESGNDTSGNVVQGDYIGTDVSGTIAVANGKDGALIDFEGAIDNTIGGTAAGVITVISGNTDDGVEISGSGASGNVVEGNDIGTDVTGGIALGNITGVEIDSNSVGNMIGGITTGTLNVISGNMNYGVEITGTGESSNGNAVEGNYIGTDVSGTLGLGNGDDGVYILADFSGNETIGGTTASAGNVISDNPEYGVEIADSTTVVVEGNFIGSDLTGRFSLSRDSQTGVGIDGNASDNTIGGSTAGARNVISGNGNYGVSIFDNPFSNLVEGDYIGTDVTGTVAVGNGNGVSIDVVGNTMGANTIGGITAGARNVISGNHLGVVIVEGTTGSVVEGNYIGTDVSGTLASG